MIAVLIWLHMNAYGTMTREVYRMPDWSTCIEAAKTARIANNESRVSVTVFCAYSR